MIKSSTVLIITLMIAAASLPTSARQSAPAVDWEAYRFLVGEWVGEGTGAPGEATGGFTYNFDLDGKVLVRRNHADYPATKDKPAYSHTDLMVMYQEAGVIKAVYFDNEGHVIYYSVSLSKDQSTLVYLSDPQPSTPRFRLTFSKASKDKMTFQFEISPTGTLEGFSKYLSGGLRRKTAGK